MADKPLGPQRGLEKPTSDSPVTEPIGSPRRGLRRGLGRRPIDTVALLIFAAATATVYLASSPNAVSEAPLPTRLPQEQSVAPAAEAVETSITVTFPRANAIFRSGYTIEGEALVNGGAVYWRLIEAGGRVLVTGQTQAEQEKEKSRFESEPVRFETEERSGTIEVYGFSPTEGEAGKVSVPVRFR